MLVRKLKIQSLKYLLNYYIAQKKILTHLGTFHLKNLTTFQLQIPRYQFQKILQIDDPQQPKNTSIFIQFSTDATLQELSKQLMERVQITNLHYQSSDNVKLHENTPIGAFFNRKFIVLSDQYRNFIIQGSYSFPYDESRMYELTKQIINMQIPATSKRQIQLYILRINKWLKFYLGKGILDDTIKFDKQTINKVLINSIIEPEPQERNILQAEKLWKAKYLQVNRLRKKKYQVDQLCFKYAYKKMRYGLWFLGGNFTFIWFGTYYYLSWDIVEPLTYFISSLGFIVLAASHLFRLVRPYSSEALMKDMMSKAAPRVYKELGFNPDELLKAECELIQLESILKDYYLRKL